MTFDHFLNVNLILASRLGSLVRSARLENSFYSGNAQVVPIFITEKYVNHHSDIIRIPF